MIYIVVLYCICFTLGACVLLVALTIGLAQKNIVWLLLLLPVPLVLGSGIALSYKAAEWADSWGRRRV